MHDDLLRWYNGELGFLRRMGEVFAREHPKIAGRLKLGPESSQDPHVERLIEAVAFLNARTRQKIEDDFPELSNAILEVLQPQFLAPIPSMLIVKLGLDEGETEATSAYDINTGTSIETETVDSEPCRFRTGYPVSLWPIRVESASCVSRPFVAPSSARSRDATAVLDIKLRTTSPELDFRQFDWSSLRFYLNGLQQESYGLYETLFNNVSEIVLARNPNDDNPVVLSPDAIRPVGFTQEELLIPSSARTAWQFRLLTEFFVFPQKFLFFDLSQLESLKDSDFGDELHIYCYLDKVDRDVENTISSETFQLGCTPAINLFEQRAEPIYLSQTDYEYPVIGDVRRPEAVEVFSIDGVFTQNDDGDEIEFKSFYSVDHTGEKSEPSQAFWHSVRRDAQLCDTDASSGSELFISFVDLTFETLLKDSWTVDIQATCLNRDLPERLPYGGGQPKLYIADDAGSVGQIKAMTPLTPTIRPELRDHARWRLISHLGIDHQSLVGDENAAATLREILSIYDFGESNATRNLINSITKIYSRRVTKRVRDQGIAGVCRGVETTIEFDKQLQNPKLYLMACVLERFLGLTCTINSFSQLISKFDKDDQIWKTWQPRSGNRTLL